MKMEEFMIRLSDFQKLLEGLVIYAIVQVGEIFGLDTVWGENYPVEIRWSDFVNPDRESGFIILDRGYGYAGFHRPTQTFHRYFDGPREHCMRVIYIYRICHKESLIEPVEKSIQSALIERITYKMSENSG